MSPQTNITSFVLRFVRETTDATTDPPQPEWRGVIKHVQTNEEQHFTRLADAIAFIGHYVDLDEFSGFGDSKMRDRDDVAPNSRITNNESRIHKSQITNHEFTNHE